MQKALRLSVSVMAFLSLSAASLPAQFIDLGFNFGAAFYSGDLSPNSPLQRLQEMRPAAGIFCRLSTSNKWSSRFNLNFASIAGDDSRTHRVQRGLAFQTNFTEFSAIAEWHAIRIRHTEYSFTFPYVFGGIGLMHFNPRREVNGEWVELQPLGTEGQGLPGYDAPYRLTQPMLPFGAGIKFITRNFTFGLEFGARFMQTDYLDDVSDRLINHQDVFLGNGPLAASLSSPRLGGAEAVDTDYRRGGASRDWAYLMNLTVSYNFGRGIHKMLSDPVPCPSFKKPTGRSL
ncbi:DUF6089 family protein [Phaeodactylibacter luteus]|uniref:DUF6089 domain-containing protein n=1 Tax=Phaeodactylibacter luteus TaxID=1564516 RepID=A0A5C6RKH3_9BACT|nr:DUF6089 family protein [Phaeodactylibacter luteus]TXB62743.1 hypothetical protein FRY97_12330 [Phaeodactylibacter luteus]